ncbi:sirohydrochlorin chelatase [Myxosarcina sp. GI1(2024)]
MLFNRNLLLSSAYMLVTHGSRDVRARWAVDKLTEQVSVLLASQNIQVAGVIESQKSNFLTSYASDTQAGVTTTASMILTNMGCPLVETGTLESASLPLHRQVQQFAISAQRAYCKRVKVLPLFLLPGIHVTEDICAEIDRAREILGDAIAIEQLPYLGSDAKLTQLWANRLVGTEADAKILFSHGTKRSGGNRTVEETAKQLGAITAYLSVSPSLDEKLELLVASGKRTIAIQPYLLCQGRIMEAMELEVMTLQTRFP